MLHHFPQLNPEYYCYFYYLSSEHTVQQNVIFSKVKLLPQQGIHLALSYSSTLLSAMYITKTHNTILFKRKEITQFQYHPQLPWPEIYCESSNSIICVLQNQRNNSSYSSRKSHIKSNQTLNQRQVQSKSKITMTSTVEHNLQRRNKTKKKKHNVYIAFPPSPSTAKLVSPLSSNG